MKIGLKFPINPKSVNPLNMTINGNKLVETEGAASPPNPVELLDSLGTLEVKDATNLEKLSTLKNILNKILPSA